MKSPNPSPGEWAMTRERRLERLLAAQAADHLTEQDERELMALLDETDETQEFPIIPVCEYCGDEHERDEPCKYGVFASGMGLK